jgi:C-terminal processing protease CtpA/Prc
MDGDNMMQQDWAREIDGITKYFHDEKIKAVVIDIRNNSGGSGPIAEYIAARFASVQKNYMKASAKNGPGRNDFSTPMTFRVRPEGTRFTKPIALLTNKATVSAAEWFTMAMKTQRHVTHVGTTTRGAFSPKTARPMINGWYYTISAFRVTDINGTCFEGRGISPDFEFIFTGDSDEEAAADGRKDTQLDKVLEIVSRW